MRAAYLELAWFHTVMRFVHRIQALLCHPIPGYSQLDGLTRTRLNAQALVLFAGSPNCARLLLWLLAWLLGGYCMVWRFDWHGLAAGLPVLTAAVWLLPAIAVARRSALRHLLGPHWSER